MIVLHKKMISFAGVCLLLFLAILSGLCIFVNSQSLWFSNLFFDKLIVFLLIPPFMFGTILVEKSMTPTLIVRTKNRNHALHLQLIQQCVLGVVYLTIWFTLLITFSLIKFGGVVSNTDAVCILAWFGRLLLGYLIIIIGTALLKKSNIWLLKSAAYVLIYLLLTLEVLAVIPEMDQQFGIEINFVFSWMFYESVTSFAAMLVILVVLTGLLMIVVLKEDIY